jgi:hypothetical protein
MPFVRIGRADEIANWRSMSESDRELVLASLASEPYNGIWNTVSWRRRGWEQHLLGEGAGPLATTLCGMPYQPELANFTPRGQIDCLGCLDMLTFPYADRQRPKDVPIPRWRLELSLRRERARKAAVRSASDRTADDSTDTER